MINSLKLLYIGAQFCPGIPDNFTTLEDIRAASSEELLEVDGGIHLFIEWIFPNSLRFPCSGQVTGWIFRAVSVDLDTIDSFPEWSIYKENTITVEDGDGDYILIEQSGGLEELTVLESGVYQYTLNSSLNVEEGDVVGVSYDASAFGTLLQLSLQDVGGNPVSYRRPFRGLLFDTGGNVIESDNNLMPLVTAIMGKYNL